MKPLVYKKAKRVRRPVPVRMKLHITKGDTVQVISGEEKGKQGKVLQVFPKTGRIKVQGVNVVKRHLRASPTAEGGIVEREASLNAANVQLVCPECGEAARVGRRLLEDGRKVRVCRKCEGVIDK